MSWVFIYATTILFISGRPIIIDMSCETCGTIERNRNRVFVGRRVCIDCWGPKMSETGISDDENAPTR
ncbi:MAG: hypothetical protein ACTSXS_09965 [Candidatus Thorarchaeota archaeon]